jgi:ribokinase
VIHVLGNATVDLILRMQSWPGPGETVLADACHRGPGGKGLNQAHAAARAGAQTRLVAPLGRDENGKWLRQRLSDVSNLILDWQEHGEVTDLSCIWINADGENIISSTADCARAILPDHLPALLDGIAPDDWFVIQGNLRADTTLEACKLACDAGARIVFNTAPLSWTLDETKQIAAACDIIISNQPEAQVLTRQESIAAAERLSSFCNGIGIVTLGAHGAALSDQRHSQVVPAPHVMACDTSGAGDTFVGYLVAGLSEGLSPLDATHLANQAAAIAVTRAGTLESAPDREELGVG